MVQPRRPQVTRGLPMQQRPSAMMQSPAQSAVPARMAPFAQRSVTPSQPMAQQAAPSRMSFGAPRVAQPQTMAAVPSQVRQQTQAPQISSYIQQQPRQQMQRIQQNQMSAYGQPQPYMDTRGGIPPAWLDQSGGQPQQPQPTPPQTGGVTPMPQQAQNGNFGAPGQASQSGAGFQMANNMYGDSFQAMPPGDGGVMAQHRNLIHLEPERYVPPAQPPASQFNVQHRNLIHLEPERYVPPAQPPASQFNVQQQMEEARRINLERASQVGGGTPPAPNRQNADGTFMLPTGGNSFTTKTGFNPENKVAGVATPAFYKQGGKVAPKSKPAAKAKPSAKPAVKGYAKGGMVMASSRGDGIAQRGKTKGRIR